MGKLERFINDDEISDLDPLIKIAIIHHQFESIHPFSDGNGRIGRILNVLYLTRSGLLDIPILYLSRVINRSKADYYRLLQAVREQNAWEDWIIYMLATVAETSKITLKLIEGINIQHDLDISRQTAAKYLEKLVAINLLTKQQAGRNQYFINTRLIELLKVDI